MDDLQTLPMWALQTHAFDHTENKSPKPPIFVIAVDGPAASGKGTLGRRIAQALSFAHLDTGLLYRAVALKLVKARIDLGDSVRAIAAAQNLDSGQEKFLDDPDLRRDDIGEGASRVAAIPEVREALLHFQRRFAYHPPGKAPGSVLDGRDIGTIICPDAHAKLYVTADIAVRAHRRVKELQSRGIPAIYDAVLADMERRDARDSQRSVAPTKMAPDAFLLETSNLDPDGAYDAAMAYIRSRIGNALRQR